MGERPPGYGAAVTSPGVGSALVVEIPAAEPAVGPFRDRLGPHDPGPFRMLTERVFAEFPAYPPFEGRFDEVIPHLTVGHGQPVAELRAAEEAIRPQLPIDGVVEAVSLLTQEAGGQWRRSARFTLSVPE